MKHTTTIEAATESTYELLVRSEKEERSLSETAVYLLLICSAVFSIWQVTQQPVTLPTGAIVHTTPLAQSSATQPSGV